MALLISKIMERILRQPPSGEWYRIGYATKGQEELIREFAKTQGFKNLRGFNTYMKSKDWDYYDVMKVSCRD